MQASLNSRTPQVSVLALALLAALMLGVAGGYLWRTLQVGSSLAPASNASSRALDIDHVTGYPAGSIDDQRILALLEEASYEGGATVVKAIDPITGYPFASEDDRRILVLLEQAGYEGGGTTVRGAAMDAS